MIASTIMSNNSFSTHHAIPLKYIPSLIPGVDSVVDGEVRMAVPPLSSDISPDWFKEPFFEEFATMSRDKALEKVNGFIREYNEEIIKYMRRAPTKKPVAVYNQLLHNILYAFERTFYAKS